MRQKYKVFLNERFVLLTNDWPKKLLKSSRFLAIQSDNKPSINKAFRTFIKDSSLDNLVIVHSDLNRLWNKFKDQFLIVEAAGGLVLNDKNEVLMIFRKGFWDLPKGKLEKNEKLKECAVREVEEECGIQNVKLEKKLCTTYHIYETKKGLNLKPSYWYTMRVKGIPKLTPQKEEDIEKAQWVSMDEANALLEKAFPSIKEVFSAYKKQS